MLVFYESNERLTIVQRALKALKAQLPFFLALTFFIVLTSLKYRDCYVPEVIAKEMFGVGPNYEDTSVTDDQGKHPKYFIYHTSIADHLIICTSYIGWICFSIFSGVGFVALPWDLIVDYVYRPKRIDEGNFNERKELLLMYALDLRERGKKLDENRNFVMQVKGF